MAELGQGCSSAAEEHRLYPSPAPAVLKGVSFQKQQKVLFLCQQTTRSSIFLEKTPKIMYPCILCGSQPGILVLLFHNLTFHPEVEFCPL